jgi:ATP-dependent Clp protease ATP-binding subunit ClpC
VDYTEEAIEACVKLTNSYMTDRFLPDKAIDALDEAGSRVHITNIDVPEQILN